MNTDDLSLDLVLRISVRFSRDCEELDFFLHLHKTINTVQG